MIDATCPLVTKVHNEARRFAAQDYDILLIGHEGHEEVIGTTGEAPTRVRLVDGAEEAGSVDVRDPAKVVWLSQTTLSVDETTETVAALRERFPTLLDPPSDDICYATQNRQLAVKQIASPADLVLVVGSQNSSNSVRLVEVAKDSGATASYLVDDASEIDEVWLDGASTIGVTSGASVPEELVDGVLAWLAERGFGDVEEVETIKERCRSRCRARSGRPASATRLKAEPAALTAYRADRFLSCLALSLGISARLASRARPASEAARTIASDPQAWTLSPPGLPMVGEQGVWIAGSPGCGSAWTSAAVSWAMACSSACSALDRHLVRVPEAELAVDHDRDLRVQMVADPAHSQAAHVDDPGRPAQRGLGCLQQGRVHGVHQPPEHLLRRILEHEQDGHGDHQADRPDRPAASRAPPRPRRAARPVT